MRDVQRLAELIERYNDTHDQHCLSFTCGPSMSAVDSPESLAAFLVMGGVRWARPVEDVQLPGLTDAEGQAFGDAIEGGGE